MAAAALVTGQENPNTLTKQEINQGWGLLFDGRSLTGWEAHGDGDWQTAGGASQLVFLSFFASVLAGAVAHKFLAEHAPQN
jgi:hypothetical protein